MVHVSLKYGYAICTIISLTAAPFVSFVTLLYSEMLADAFPVKRNATFTQNAYSYNILN